MAKEEKGAEAEREMMRKCNTEGSGERARGIGWQ